MSPLFVVSEMTDIISRIPPKDFVIGDDGFVFYWPDFIRGAMSARDLRAIADEMDRRNAHWQSETTANWIEK